MATAQELPIVTGVDAMQMAEAMFGSGIQIVSATYQGDPLSAGLYSDGLTVAPGVTPSDSGVILSTGHVTSFTNTSGDVNLSSGTSTDTAGVDGDPIMDAIAGAPTFDAAMLTAEFIPLGSILTMQVTFSSEEYLEYIGSGFNDAVGIWVNGVKAELTVGTGGISIDNINPTSNPDLYVDNANDLYNTEMDGFTVTLTLKVPVNPGQVNTIIIGIADGGDADYDSNLMIAANSVQTEVIATDDAFLFEQDGEVTVDLTGNDFNASGGTLTITKINGVDVFAGSVITLPSGLDIQVNSDGTITVIGQPADPTMDTSFSYEVSNENGITDVGFVQGQVVPCFVAGARIETDRGPVVVEALEPGDMVLTLDDGYQPVRWCGGRTVASTGALAAVIIPAGTLGDHGSLRVSPQHRLHLSGWRAELYCGETEVLVKAAHLVRAGRLRQDCSGAPVTYHHILFDRHQIICAEGVWSESYHPGPATLADHDDETRAELLALFPSLGSNPDHGYGPIARPEATSLTAALLVA